MSRLQAKTIVRCPLSQAPVYFDRFFAERSGGEPGHLALTLRVPLDLPGTRDLALECDVAVRIERAPAHNDGGSLRVSWHPIQGGPFPSFHGALNIEADEDYASSRLSLEGEYTPPLGSAGVAFDAAIGHRIALATARDLLKRIAGYVELEYEQAESTKALARHAAEAS